MSPNTEYSLHIEVARRRELKAILMYKQGLSVPSMLIETNFENFHYT